jgi:hypothetical protein
VLLHHALQLDGLQMHLVPLHPDLVHLLAVATFLSAVKPDGRSLGELRRAGPSSGPRGGPSLSLSLSGDLCLSPRYWTEDPEDDLS